MNKSTKTEFELKLLEIAKDCFDIETLETQNSDSLDFHEVAVWQIEKALKEAFKLGRKFHS